VSIGINLLKSMFCSLFFFSANKIIILPAPSKVERTLFIGTAGWSLKREINIVMLNQTAASLK